MPEFLLHLILQIIPFGIFAYISVKVNLRFGINKKLSKLFPNDTGHLLIWILVYLIINTSISLIFRSMIESEAIISIVGGITLGITLSIAFPFEQFNRKVGAK